MAWLSPRIGPPLAIAVASLALGSLKAPGEGQGGADPSGACDANPPAKAEIELARIPQEEEMWCWAAAGEMIMQTVKPSLDVQQCDQVNKRLKTLKLVTRDCCGPSRSFLCTRTAGSPEFQKYGFSFIETGTSKHPKTHLEWDEIRREIGCRRRPFAFAWSFGGTGGHMIVAVGYETVGSQRFLIAVNPRKKAGPEDAEVDEGDEDEVRLRYTFEGYRDGTSFEKHKSDIFAVTPVEEP